MKEKIKQYVEYQFRFDNRVHIKDLKEEIIANLTDRYDDLVSSGKDSEDAYIEAIKSMGDFSEHTYNEIPEEFSVKPSIPDILLMSGAILSIFGLIITLLNVTTGTIVTSLSILLFSGGAYYLYSYSQYIRKEKMDIEQHNVLLSKIFKYIKTSFVFWSISLSLTMTSIAMRFFTPSIALSVNPLGDSEQLSYDSLSDSVNEFILRYIIIFIVTLIIFLLVFKGIYGQLMNRYYVLTGSKTLKGKIGESYDFLYGDSKYKSYKLKSVVMSSKFYSILGFIFIIPNLLLQLNYGSNSQYGHISKSTYGLTILGFRWLESLVALPILIIVFTLMIKGIIGSLKRTWLLIVSYYLWFGITIVTDVRLENRYEYVSDEFSIYAFVMAIILSVILFLRTIYIARIKGE